MDSSTSSNSVGFQVPAEWERHDACLIAWPFRPDVFPFDVKGAMDAYLEVVKAISKSEKIILFVPPGGLPTESKAQIEKEIADGRVVIVDSIRYDEEWTRDVGPTYVRGGDSVKGIVWKFNGWGGLETACTDFASDVCKFQEIGSCYPDLICEGGALAFDGEGTVITTESVLLSEKRNGAEKTKSEVEDILKQYLGCSKVVWLPEGVHGDNGLFTGGHVDNLVAFVQPAEVVLAWTDNESDPQYSVARRTEEILLASTDAKGRSFKVHHLVQPDPPLFVSEEESASFKPGILPPLEAGTQLPGSYVNFYISNSNIVVPQFDRPLTDTLALEALKNLIPNREVIGIKRGREILLGGGCVHCITQQVPAVQK